ncbi:MAG: CDP-diacylglycerol--serine O-phosphatidyltransferase [Desulfitobacteriaceae bacterium]|nr:CDP-diacylglycerol--serine O-phosphatidyltransferase [Desulfitobacteriaceae bacterium]MDD4345759.1 CDP-diacylglycerol--serine O-phosphatidyltransferase [Desulfitobacteriaceae bacterium]MDD4400964.1 CDP-diacylglycerol--serine O-phosphatidyltransferase [Desulfitobacteriaceae bacterium]
MRVVNINTNIIPNIFTLANLFFGFLSLTMILDGKISLAAIMIILAVILDSLDGKVARIFSVSSDFGKQLDSLCDLVSFGVAPAILVYKVFLQEHLGYFGLLIAAVFTLCGAVRLARFNILNVTTHFVGVPITFAGGFMALLMLFYKLVPWGFYPVILIILAFLMVSTFRVPKLGK